MRFAWRAASAFALARFFSSLVVTGAREETIRFDSASLRFGVGRPFLPDPLSVLVMAVTIEPAFFPTRV